MMRLRFAGLLLLMLLLLPLLPGCGGSDDTDIQSDYVVLDDDFSDGTTRAHYRDLEFTMTFPKLVYAQGERIAWNFTVKNVGIERITVAYGSSNIVPFVVTRQGQIIWGTGDEEATLTRVTLESGETKVYQHSWMQKEIGAPPRDVSSGEYWLRQWLEGSYDTTSPPYLGPDAQTATVYGAMTASPVKVTIQ